ncbi:hypothetical protein D0B54_00685 [Solimonas sp. K1W22B-7]|nr:hypothetical protein D0B54_00685 [Solimonas sp. K1W22B-7]
MLFASAAQVSKLRCCPLRSGGVPDVRARYIGAAMKAAAIRAVAAPARVPAPQEVLAAHGQNSLSFAPDYIIPKPLDPDARPCRPAVARAAVSSGTARLPYPAHYPA